jgi:hypothetical protein
MINSSTYGMCDGLGNCQPITNYSCPDKCEKNIVSGCHNYTLNPTQPCTALNLCNYDITLFQCSADEICLNSNDKKDVDITNQIVVHIDACTEIQNDSVSTFCYSYNLTLIAYEPKIVSVMLNEDPFRHILIEYAPGIFLGSEFFNFTSNTDNKTSLCISRWDTPTSQPYCQYDCYPGPIVGYVFGHDCGFNCTEFNRLTITYLGENSNGNTDNTHDTHSDGYRSSSFYIQVFVVLMIANLLLN